MKKYVIFGGKVKSKYDGEEHYIPPYRVAELYGLNPHSPNVKLISGKNFEMAERELRGLDNSWIPLFPRSDGKYKLEGK